MRQRTGCSEYGISYLPTTTLDQSSNNSRSKLVINSRATTCNFRKGVFLFTEERTFLVANGTEKTYLRCQPSHVLVTQENIRLKGCGRQGVSNVTKCCKDYKVSLTHQYLSWLLNTQRGYRADIQIITIPFLSTNRLIQSVNIHDGLFLWLRCGRIVGALGGKFGLVMIYKRNEKQRCVILRVLFNVN